MPKIIEQVIMKGFPISITILVCLQFGSSNFYSLFDVNSAANIAFPFAIVTATSLANRLLLTLCSYLISIILFIIFFSKTSKIFKRNAHLMEEQFPSNSAETSLSETTECSPYQQLLQKYNSQQTELERAEEQNHKYREKLIKTIRERDLNDELLKSVRDEMKKETEELKRKIREQEVQFKAVQDKATAKEAHYNVTLKDLSLKYNNSVTQLTKKADVAEKEKNEAVIKYATREAEIMKIKSEIQKKEQELNEVVSAKKELENSQAAENVEKLEKTVNSLRVDLEKIKHEKFDVENRLKMTEKRVEAGHTSVSELRQQCEVLRKQLIQLKEEKSQLSDENKILIQRTQQQESRIQLETDNISKSCSDMESRLRETYSDISRLREENRNLQEQVDSVGKENLELLTKLQDLEDKLQIEEEKYENVRQEVERLSDIESKVKRSLEAAIYAKSAQDSAEKDRDTSEKEAESCRLQAERMLQITEQLTQRNSQLANEAEQFREKNRRLEQELVEAQGALARASSRLEEREKDLNEAQGININENERLKEELRVVIAKEKELSVRLTETKNDYAAYKKKQAASIKELKQELAHLRKLTDSGNSEAYLAVDPVDGIPSSCSRSRTNSLTSLDRVTSTSQEEASSAKPAEELNPGIQQAMIDKIVLLQKKLARRTEKIEFLEEHVRQCLEELQKKTKIIQHYILREEASLLLPADNSLEQIPAVKKGSSYALMGSIFTSGEGKKSIQLATEVNSRLQAVLEDTMMKNITLKNSVDQLSAENSRLSRENRFLTLTQAKN